MVIFLFITASSTATSIVISSAATQSALTSTAASSSQPITVQIQSTPQGTRLMIPSGQLSQLRGSIHLVQAAGGQSSLTTSRTAATTTTTSAVGEPKLFSLITCPFEYKTVTASRSTRVVIHKYSEINAS